MTIPTDQSEMSWQHLSLFSSPLSLGTNRLPPEEPLSPSSGAQSVPAPNVTGLRGPWRPDFPSDGLVPLSEAPAVCRVPAGPELLSTKAGGPGAAQRLHAAARSLPAHQPHPSPAGINGTKGE